MKVKQVIVIRKDLKMRRGKEIAQGAHASMAFLLRKPMFDSQKVLTRIWVESGQPKICLVVNSEKELREIYDNADEAGLNVHMITDSGKTEFGGKPTLTCLAIGPNKREDIDEITGGLKLY